MPGTVMGTAAYMSPEQARGEELDARTDIFSFGAVLYEMVTGQTAFSRSSTVSTFDAILHSAPPAPVRLNPTVPPELERIIDRSLEKDRELRYQTASELRAELRRLQRATESHPAAVATAAHPPRSRSGWRTRAMVGALALVAIALAGYWFAPRAPALTVRGRNSRRHCGQFDRRDRVRRHAAAGAHRAASPVAFSERRLRRPRPGIAPLHGPRAAGALDRTSGARDLPAAERESHAERIDRTVGERLCRDPHRSELREWRHPGDRAGPDIAPGRRARKTRRAGIRAPRASR